MTLFIQSLFFLLPAYLANAISGLSSHWQFLALPLDFGKKIGHNFLLGPNKTFRGTLIGILTTIITVQLQKLLFAKELFQNISLIDYQQINCFLFGLAGGLGAVGGDIFSSFIKRRLNLLPGAPLPFLDQWNFIIGYFFLTSFFVDLPLNILITSLILTLIIHPLVNIIAYFLKIKKVWW